MLTTALTIAGAVAGILVVVFVVLPLLTAGRGAFLKERNEELAQAVEQMRQQRDDDRKEYERERDEDRKAYERELTEQRDQINQLRGEVAAHRVQYAQVIAAAVAPAVIDALERSGVIPKAETR